MRFKGKLALAILSGLVVAGCEDADFTGFRAGGASVNTINTVPPTPPTVTLQAPSAPAAEGTNLIATVVLSKTFNQAVTVPFTVTLGTAGVNDILVTTTSPVSIPAGQTSGTIVIQVVNDPIQEEPPVETFTLALGSPSSGALGTPSSAVLSITDADDDTLGNSISGRVTNANTGAGIAGVAVSSVGAVTDALGFYTITNLPPAASILVPYTLTGYVPQSRTTEAMTTANSAVVINVPMVPVAFTDTFDPTTAHVSTVPGSTGEVTFAANSVETTGGAAPTGNVTASVTPISPSADVNVMPGMYRAGDGVAPPVSVETFGALGVSLVDSGGAALRLISGQSATIRIPAATRGTPLPATLSLYYFDEALGLWRQQGTATLAGTAPLQYYQGTIQRFATWGANVAYTSAQISGCVVDTSGSRVPEATVISEGTNYVGTGTVVTDALGEFDVPVRASSDAYAQANFRSGLSNALTAPVSPPLEFSDCLLVVAGAASIKLTWGERPFDLDSHMLGPNRNDHVYWPFGERGSLTAPPFVGLDVDDTTGFGPEVTTIVKAAKSRTYSFYVRNFSQSFNPGQTASPAKVELYVKGKQTIFTPPPGEGTNTVWHVFDIQSDASCVTTVTVPAVPWLTMTDAQLDDPAFNPNTDNNATFCN